MPTLRKIMIVDDDAVVRTGLRGMIGYTRLFEIMGEANNGNDFLLSLQETETEFAILDLQMPGIYGTEVARKALEIKPDLKIIIFSACVNKEDLIMLLDMGIIGFILKTEGFEQILRALTNAVNGIPYYSPELVGYVVRHSIPQNRQAEFTHREIEILSYMCKGFCPDEIAEKLYISNHTVEKHRSNMLDKVHKKSTLGLVLYAIKNGIIPVNRLDYKSGTDKKNRCQ